jgi:hypothetical protein
VQAWRHAVPGTWPATQTTRGIWSSYYKAVRGGREDSDTDRSQVSEERGRRNQENVWSRLSRVCRHDLYDPTPRANGADYTAKTAPPPLRLKGVPTQPMEGWYSTYIAVYERQVAQPIAALHDAVSMRGPYMHTCSRFECS